ncbi:site-specific integrase [Bradyrhizobium sp. AUGA SZCCT0177]|nr:site-specific integrase [Bradyrhizobium sp. AUGA SZCCT0177]
MTESMMPLEPTFAAAMIAIEVAADLSASVKRHWICSLRQIAKWLDRPVEVTPARWTAIRLPVGLLHHARLGVTPKTVANHRANAAAALRWFGKEFNVPARGVALSAEWATLRDGIGDRGRRARLYGLMRYCSGRGLMLDAVDDTLVADYLRYRAETTSLAAGSAAHRSIARAWNLSAGENPAWPARRLTEPPVKAQEGPAWEEFPEGLRRDIVKYLAGLGKIRKGPNGKRSRPCSPRTVKTRRAELVAVARMAVKIGLPIESLKSLAALVHPDVAAPVLDAYWENNGAEPKVYTIDLAWKLLSVARQTGLDQASIERLDDMRVSLEEHRHGGLTAKNLDLIRQVLTDGIWSEVVSLPNALMRQARADQAHAPVKAALTAQLAVAIAILSFAPVRLTNLVSIELGKNLIKPGGQASPFWLVFPHYDVKNRVTIEFTFDKALTGLIDEYIHEFRSTLARGSNTAWLFPGVAGKPKTANMFSTQITERIQKVTGVRMTVHQFRHACAAIYLKHRPGEYETVKRLLGHRNIQTTVNFYCGLETTQANEAFGKIIREHIKFEDAA